MDHIDEQLIVPRLLLLHTLREKFCTKLPSILGRDQPAFCLRYLEALEAMRDEVVSEAVRIRSVNTNNEVLAMVSTILGQAGRGGARRAADRQTTRSFWHSMSDDQTNDRDTPSVTSTGVALFCHALDNHLLSFLHAEPLYTFTLMELLMGALPHPTQSCLKFVEATFLDDKELRVVGVCRGEGTSLQPLPAQPSDQRHLLTFGLLMIQQLIREVAHFIPPSSCPPYSRLAAVSDIIDLQPFSTAAATTTKKITDRIFYVTDRPTIPGAANRRASFGNLGELKFGIAEVEIEVAHPALAPGPLESTTPSSCIYISGYTQMRNDHVRFIEEINSQLTTTNDTNIVIYIHGYNTDFEDSIKTGAQLKHDLKLGRGAFVSYTWSSSSARLNLIGQYFRDEAAVQSTIPYLASLIKECIQKVKGGRLHLLAHSMGNRALMGALTELYKVPREWIGLGMPLRTVISAAADEVLPHLEDRLRLAKEICNTVPQECRHRFAVYCADDDWALQLARTIFFVSAQNGREPRVGQTSTHFKKGATTLSEPPETGFLDVMDATGAVPKVLWVLPRGINHGYFSSEAAVVYDIEQLVSNLGKEHAMHRLAAPSTSSGLHVVHHQNTHHFYTFFPKSWK